MVQNNDILELPHENIKKKLNEIIRSKGLVKYDVEISSGSKKGDNYVGIVYKIAVSGTMENGEAGNLNLFCKIPVEMEGFREEDGSNAAFKRENKFYDSILQKLKQFEREKFIENGFSSYVKCFATSSVNFEEYLIMEDLTKRNFAMFDRLKQIDLKHTTLVMKALGKLHALSFAIRDQKPELIKEFSQEIPEIYMVEGKEMPPMFVNFVNNFLNSAVEKLSFEGIYQEKWENFHTNFYKLIKSCFNPDLTEPYAVVTHGDCWNNNMMFKYENGLPTEVCLLDWQITRYGSPILDLVYYLFCSTEKSFRDQHYQSLLNIYHDSLSTYLKELGSDPEKLFSYSEFQNQLKKFGKFGLGMACLVMPLFVTKEEDAAKFDDIINDVSKSTENSATVDIWTTRVSDVLKDIVDLGYL